MRNDSVGNINAGKEGRNDSVLNKNFSQRCKSRAGLRVPGVLLMLLLSRLPLPPCWSR